MTVTPAASGDLEVLPLVGEVRVAATEAPRPVRRRWLWAVGAAVVRLGALIFPVRSALAHTELDRIQGVWASVLAMDGSRTDAVNRLAGMAVAADTTTVRQAEIALDLEEWQGLQRLARGLPADRALDGGISNLRRAIALAVRLDIADLRTAADARTRADASPNPDGSASTIAAFQQVDSLLRAQRRRFGEDTASVPVSRAALHSADGALVTLSHYVPVPVGVKLLVNTDFGVRILDIDRGTDTRAAVGAGSQVLPIGSFVVVADGGRVYRLPLNLGGPRRDLGTGTVVYPGGPPDAVWIYDNGTFREITTAGDILVEAFPPRAMVRGFVGAGLVVGDNSSGLEVIGTPPTPIGARPTPNPVVRDISSVASATVTAASGDLVVWTLSAHPAFVHVSSVGRPGSDKSLEVPSGYQATGFGAISPDSRRVALYLLNQATAAFQVAVIDLATDRVDLIPGSDTVQVQPDVVWTPDSQRIFFVTNQAGATIATWHSGDPSALTLRWRGATAQALAVVS